MRKECTCNDYHCETCNPLAFQLNCIREGIDHARKQLSIVGDNFGVREDFIVQAAASHAIDVYIKRTK